MQALSQEVMAKLEREVPDFIKAVHAPAADSIILTVLAFAGEPELFYQCVTYATQNGKNVMVAPAPPAS